MNAISNSLSLIVIAAVLLAIPEFAVSQNQVQRPGQRPQGQQFQGLRQQRPQNQQGRSGQGQQGQANQQQQRRIAPIVAALDVNGDTIISKEEIANAYAALKKLDRNGDGKISTNEFRNQGAPDNPQGGPPKGGPGQGAGQGGPGQGGPGMRGPGQGGPGQGRGPGQGQGGPGQGRGPGQGQGLSGSGQGDGFGRGGGASRTGQGGQGQGMRGQGGGQGQGRGQGGAGQRGPGQAMRGQGGGQPSDILNGVNPSEVNPRDLPDRPRDIRFRNSIEIGSTLPESIEIYNTKMQKIPLNQLFADRPTVVVTGCLTCPAFLNAYQEVEAVYADYKDKADFYYSYHVLAHPENRGYIQPMTIEERFQHIAEAKRTLGTKVPWIADSMDNKMKEHYVFASNPEFIFDSNGKVVHREPWTRGTSLRSQLEKLVGPSSKVTTIDELNLPEIERVTEGDRSGIVERVQVNGIAVPLKFTTQQSDQKWFAKLRPEADQQLVNSGNGQMYLGFHLDPIHNVKWNNLAAPLKYEIMAPAGVSISPASGQGVQPKVETDGDPREFLVDVQNWSSDQPLTVKVSYIACNKDNNSCVPVIQEYKVNLQNDPAAGRVNGRTHRAGGQGRAGQRGGQGRGGAGGQGRGPGQGGQGRGAGGRQGRGPAQGGQGRGR